MGLLNCFTSLTAFECVSCNSYSSLLQERSIWNTNLTIPLFNCFSSLRLPTDKGQTLYSPQDIWDSPWPDPYPPLETNRIQLLLCRLHFYACAWSCSTTPHFCLCGSFCFAPSLFFLICLHIANSAHSYIKSSYITSCWQPKESLSILLNGFLSLCFLIIRNLRYYIQIVY